MFRHPKYYKELRKLRNKSDQVISDECATAPRERAPGRGQVSSNKRQLQAASYKLQATSFKRLVKLQATSVECGPNRQAPSMAFRDDLTADRGSLYSRKVLRVQERRLGHYDKVTFSSGLMKQFLMR